MFEKIKDISKVIILPTTLLYFFGFLSISSYYARFGIVSFDIINSRFIIAGFFSFVSLLAVFYVSWYSYTLFDSKSFFKFISWKKIKNRPLGLFYLIAFTYVISTILTALFKLGNFTKIWQESSLVYKFNFGKYDFFASFINKHDFGSPSIDFILKATLNFFFYIIIIVLFIILIIILIRWARCLFNIKPKKSQEKINLAETRPEDIVSAENNQISNLFNSTIAILVDILCLIILVSVFAYSLIKLYVNVVNMNSFNDFHLVNSGLIFSWLFITETFVFLFLVTKEFPKEKGKLSEFFKKMNNPDNVQHILQILIIPIFTSLFLFGVTIFPRIPYSLGGGQPREINLIFKQNQYNDIGTQKTYQIGENSNFIFIVIYGESTQAMQVNKDIVDIVKTTSSNQ